jgi:hypothetical protein
MKATFTTILSSIFPDFVNMVSDFILGIRQQTITLENIEKFVRPLVLDNPDNAQQILQAVCTDAVWLASSFLTRGVKMSDDASSYRDICSYLKFLAQKDIITELLQCARYFCQCVHGHFLN